MSVVIEQLSKHFGTQKAVDQISFEATQGSILGFLGPNGAGKSTTMKMITGFLRPTEGQVWVDGIPVTKDPMTVKQKVGYLPEHNPMYMEMYVREFLSFIGKAYGLSGKHIKSRVQELIEVCGLEIEAHKKILTLSKGYRQRVGLAKALMADPAILILDEPTSGLDPNQLIEVRRVIKNIATEKTVILSTHIMQEVEALCEDVVIINKGKIVADDTLSHLRSGTKEQKISVTFEKGIDEAQVQIQLGELEGCTVSYQGQNVWVITSEKEDLRTQVLEIVTKKKLPLNTIQDVGGDLESIFYDLTKGKEEVIK